MKYILSALALILFSTAAKAASPTITPYLGIDLGVATANGVGNEARKSGYSVAPEGTLNFGLDKDLSIDATVGFQYLRLSGNGTTITTTSVFAEGGLQYKFIQDFSVGPALRIGGGTDTTNSDSMGSNSVNVTALIKGKYWTHLGQVPTRFTITLGSTINLDRNQTSLMLGVEFGLPEFNKKQSYARPQTVKAYSFKKETQPTTVSRLSDKVKPVTISSRPPSSAVQKQAPVAVVKTSPSTTPAEVQTMKVFFATDSEVLTPKETARIERLAKYLKTHDSAWGRVKVSGHADATGDNKENKILSQNRADAVVKIFVKEGISEDKIAAHGFSSTRPMDVNALNKNRRTEIEVYGVHDRAQFNKDTSMISK